MNRRIIGHDWKGITRRDALGLLGAASAGLGLGTACGDAAESTTAGLGVGSPDEALLQCVLTPEATEGPFFVDEQLNRSDLLEGETDPAVLSGYPLSVDLAVYGVRGATCQPLVGAVVDIWQANVDGLYSDEPSNFVQTTETLGKKYLRALQITGDSGLVTFKTIYPGWYFTRTIHIHVKVRIFSMAGDKTFEANAQLYFSNAMNDAVLALPAYAARGPRSIPLNTNDQVYNGTGPGSGIDNVGLANGQVPPGDSSVAVLSAFDPMLGSRAALSVGVQLP